MKRTLIILITLLAVTLIHADEHDLWQKVNRIANQNWNLVPGKTTTITETRYAENNELISATKLVVTHSQFEDMVTNELVLSEVNGEAQNLDEARSQFQQLLMMDNTPDRKGLYFQQQNENLTYAPNGERKNINGFDCIGFDYTHIDKDADNTYSGTIWLDSASGAPIMRRFGMEKNPRFVTDIEVTHSYHYEPGSGQWYLESIDTFLTISAMGQNMVNDNKIIYEDHWEYQD